jgi:Putative peptidoglycan binding domain
MAIGLARFHFPGMGNGMPRIATTPALVIGLLSASLFGLFYMAALNNPSIVKPPRPVIAAPEPKPAAVPAPVMVTAPPAVPSAVTPQHVAPDLTRNLTRGEMREAQTLLRAAGYDPGPADGLMGPKTRTAIASFGEAHGIQLTPEPQLKLLEALRAAAR